MFQVRPGCEDRFLEAFYPIVNDIEGLWRPLELKDEEGESTYDLNKVTEVLVKRDSLTFWSANILRNQLNGLSDLESGFNRKHMFRSCVIKDFSATGAARTYAVDVPTFLKHNLFHVDSGDTWDRKNGYWSRHLAKSALDPYKR